MRATAIIWIAIALLIGLLCASQLNSILNPPGMSADKARLMRLVNELEKDYENTEPNQRQEFNAKAIEKISDFKAEKKGTRGSIARIKLILTQALNPSAPPEFGELNAETDDVIETESRQKISEIRKKLNVALTRLYSSKSLTTVESKEISKVIRQYASGGWPYELAVQRASELSAEPRVDKTFRLMNVISVGFLGGGILCWLLYFSYRARNELVPVGTPMANEPREIGDSFGARFFLYIIVFGTLPAILAPFFITLFGDHWGSSAGGWFASILSLCLIVIPIYNVKGGFEKVGISKMNFGLNCLWGFAAFLANLPVLVIAQLLGEKFLDWIPTGEHPAIQSLAEPATVLPTLVSAVLVAAIAEEVFFRGCLFQGILIRLKSPFWAVLLSSLCFAAIHPQGGAAWLGLGFIGAMGAMMFHQTGSLIPAIVMHAFNNLFAIIVALNSA